LTAVLSSSPEIDCREAEPRLHLFLDRELAPEDQAALEAHLEACARCRADLQLLERTRAKLRAMAESTDVAPSALVDKIAGDVGRVARRERRGRLLWAAPLVVATAALIIALFSLFGGADRAPEPLVLQESVDVHTLDVPVDVASPDPQRVEKFLAPRLGVNVRVPRLDGAGLSLAGGRVVSVDNRRAAQLVYEDGLGAKVSVLAVPDKDRRMAAALSGQTPPPTARGAAVTQAGFVEQVPEPIGGRVRKDGHAVRLWHDGEVLYTLVGALDDEGMDRISRALADNGRRVAGR
jgi:anti-sigma factor RsiW